MRLMSFRLTVEQMRARTKTVTRRFGWWELKPGDVVQPVVKAQGLRKGEHVEKIGPPIRIVATRVEPLDAITAAECVLEGFPDRTPHQFAAMFVVHYSCGYGDLVNRIEFEFTEVTHG